MAGLHTLFSSYYSKYSNDDYDWVHYLHDHFVRLRLKAIYSEMDPYKMNEMHYRLADYLAECNIPKEADWIVLYLNQLGSDKDFKNLTWLWLPNMSDIELMRQEFDTQRAHAKSIIRRA